MCLPDNGCHWRLARQCLLEYIYRVPDTHPHRKTVKHVDEPGHVHELTFSCYQRRPLLRSDTWKTWLGQSIDRASDRHEFALVAFVFMPEHVHLLVYPRSDGACISRLLYAIKRPFSFRIKQYLKRTGHPLLSELTIRERPGRQVFRFWQEGGGYDRNLLSPNTVRQAVDYLHNNPVRRDLCRDAGEWGWSSWGYYHEPEDWTRPDLPRVHGLPW